VALPHPRALAPVRVLSVAAATDRSSDAPYGAAVATGPAGERDLVTAARLSLAAGVVFLLTVAYLFTVLPATGWDLAMFDDPAALLPWAAAHPRVYQGLWLLYFASQACLLGVPVLLRRTTGALAATLGTSAVVLAMTGLGVLVAVSPVLARAYAAAGSGPDPAAVLLLHDVTADVGKDLRLLSEVLLGLWLVLAGRGLRLATGARAWWALSALGAWTVVVALVKLAVPTIGLEDWLGFLLGLGYLALGVGLLRRRRLDRVGTADAVAA
jgi:hypothetical protein